MASVTFNNLWLHDVDNHASRRGFGFSESSRQADSNARVLRMANGRVVSVRTPGVERTWSVVVRYANRADAEWLLDRVGGTLLVRTPHGDRFYGVLRDLSGTEELLGANPHTKPIGSIGFSFTEVSLSIEE